MVKLTVRKFGRSLGMTLPARTAKALNVDAGDALYLVKSADGFRITAQDPEFTQAMDIAAGFMGRYQHALRDLGR